LLKALGFAVGLLFAARGLAAAQETSDLIVGSVRDSAGAPIAGAVVRALDGASQPVGSDLTAADGTFALQVARPAVSLEIGCSHCPPERLALDGRTNIVAIVPRFKALENALPDSADLAALPYGRPADALALIPYVLPEDAGQTVSDRGLGGGRGLVLDDGAPMTDLATGESALINFPDRYARTVGLTGPEEAYRYGDYGGGGIFALDQFDAAPLAGGFDLGNASSFALEPGAALVYPALGESSDDGVFARRADIDVASGFAGGFLRVGAGAGNERYGAYTGDDARSFDTFRASYATVSRRYRTFADFAAAGAASYGDLTGAPNYDASYVSAEVRVERPGPVRLVFGATANAQTATAPQAVYSYLQVAGRTSDATLYAEAATGDERANARVGLGLTDLASYASGAPAAHGFALVPSLGGRLSLGGGVYARAGYSEALLAPTLLEAAAAPAGAAAGRNELAESAIGIDTGARVRAEAIAFRQYGNAYGAGPLEGLGASLVWQIAPLLSVRAWTLHDVPLAPPGAYGADEFSRQVVWASYANGAALRFDAILHRDVVASRGASNLDADVYVPVAPPVALDVGTSRRLQVRRYYFGVRLR
jgi:hypothetical protein